MADDITNGSGGDSANGAAPEGSATGGSPTPAAGAEKSFRPSPARIVVWVVVAGVGVYLIASGIVGMIAKG
jgi:hypothetical protein